MQLYIFTYQAGYTPLEMSGSLLMGDVPFVFHKEDSVFFFYVYRFSKFHIFPFQEHHDSLKTVLINLAGRQMERCFMHDQGLSLFHIENFRSMLIKGVLFEFPSVHHK